jgi:hypothetical protein
VLERSYNKFRTGAATKFAPPLVANGRVYQAFRLAEGLAGIFHH